MRCCWPWACFFATFYKYDNYLDMIVMSDVIFRLCVKFLYLIGVDDVFMVFGMMFSGKLETSHGNTIYQNLVFFLYLGDLLSRNKEDPEYFLLMEAIRFKLLTRGFSGDDMFQGWPQYLERMGVGLLGYEKFCKKIGLLFKYCTISQLYADVFL